MDHLIFAVPDLEEGVRLVESRLGVESTAGGRHEGLGTRNRLFGLGPDSYLEVVSVDPDQPQPDRPRWFGLDDLREPRLVSWCSKSSDLDALVARGRAAGIELGDPVEGSRRRADGVELRWTFTDPWADRAGGVIPFFIDWGESEHPARSLPATCRFRGLRLEHPDASKVTGWLDALGLDMKVHRGHAARIVARIETPSGVVELS